MRATNTLILALCSAALVSAAPPTTTPSAVPPNPAVASAQHVARQFVEFLVDGNTAAAQRQCMNVDELVELFPTGPAQRPQIEKMLQMRRQLIEKAIGALKGATITGETAGKYLRLPIPDSPDNAVMEQVTGIKFTVRKPDGTSELVRVGAIVKSADLWWIVEGALLGPEQQSAVMQGGRVVVSPPPATQP